MTPFFATQTPFLYTFHGYQLSLYSHFTLLWQDPTRDIPDLTDKVIIVTPEQSKFK
jgi:hypothetical protein